MSVSRYQFTAKCIYSKQVAVFYTTGFGGNGVGASVGAMGVCESVRQ